METQPTATLPTKDNVLTITSVDSSDKIAENANTGADVDFALPGVLILAPYKRLMMVDSGTSLAAPHAAAAAALLKSWCKHLNQDQVVDILKQYSVDLGAKGFDNTYGWTYDYDRFIDPAYPDREGYTIKFLVDIYNGTEEDGRFYYRTITHRQVIDQAGNIVEDTILNPGEPGKYAMDTYYEHP